MSVTPLSDQVLQESAPTLGDALDEDVLPTVDRTAEAGRFDFYRRASAESLAPLWRVLNGLVSEQPRQVAQPALWPYKQVRPFLHEACRIIGTREAERRVMILENPGLPGQSRITPSLFAGLQIILPGEIAPAHRHVASALRFIVEGKDAYTAVEGERTTMLEGDFIITPSWRWHDHGNDSDAPVVWLDGLDMHIVNLLSCSFRENHPDDAQPLTRPEGNSWTDPGNDVLPIDFKPSSQTSPIFKYPYRSVRETLHRISTHEALDACHGFKVKYINPATGGDAMPTLSTAMQLLPMGFRSNTYRSTAGTVYSVVEGHGTATVGGQTLAFAPRDHFVVPSWVPVEFHAREEAVLFSFSDRVVQEKLDFFRELRGNGR